MYIQKPRFSAIEIEGRRSRHKASSIKDAPARDRIRREQGRFSNT
jgi:hypothetical protein